MCDVCEIGAFPISYADESLVAFGVLRVCRVVAVSSFFHQRVIKGATMWSQ
jgi:hypothetical protein